MNVQEELLRGIESVKARFDGPKNTEELFACARELLLNQPFQYVISNVCGQPDSYRLSMNVNIRNESELNVFVNNYARNNGETLRISKVKKVTNRSKYCVNQYFRCQHNTRVPSTKNIEEILRKKPSKRLKNTNCPFTLSAKIDKDPSTLFPCKIEIDWSHNHQIDTLQANSFKDLSENVTDVIRQYFANGMSPGTAYKEFISNLGVVAKQVM
jgi:hypothetical protein